MTDDASTAYICIYCPFNSSNLEALETHLTSAHGHGCQDAPSAIPQSLSLLSSSSSSNVVHKASKREAPDDEQSRSSADDGKSITDLSSGAKRIKRAVSPISQPTLFINNPDEKEGDDDEEDDDEDEDERDSPSNSTASAARILLTCPACGSTYHRLGHLLRHAKRKHHIDLMDYQGPHTFDMLTAQAKEAEASEIETNAKFDEQRHSTKTVDLSATGKPSLPPNGTPLASVSDADVATTDCPYCDYKTKDIEQFKLHIIAHIRDKNYRCLLCNRLYKYRGDCSFHIRRKHHRYSANSNDYIQRFLFDASDGSESMVSQTGGLGSSNNGSINGTNTSREPDEPVRYFGCPYCDYTSNYGGDVRKHQARKHPNVESKVVKITRQETEHSSSSIVIPNHSEQISTDHHDDDQTEERAITTKSGTDLPEQQPPPRPRKEKIKTVKRIDTTMLQNHPPALTIPPNFAPVRVFQCSSCHQQGTYKWVVERHIRAKHPDQPDAHVIELPAELAVKLQKISPPLKRFRCSLCPLQSKHTWVIIRHIKHFHTLQTASVLDIQPDGTPENDELMTFQNGDFSTKTFDHDSELSSTSSSCGELRIDEHNGSYCPPDVDHAQEGGDESDHVSLSMNNHSDGTSAFLYKCSLCEFTSNIPWTIQKHINELHPGQANAHMLTQSPSTSNGANHKGNPKKSKHKNGHSMAMTTVGKMTLTSPLSPASALAKAKFSPAVEEALLSLQGSKFKNAGFYVAQPKFGIKRLKCRHCFYRSNWKTDMIRHVRIRHCLTEPDHNKDMITMTEEEARSTIETYENTFGKELRRRTFRTWNDWAKAEQEFTPKDGSLEYSKMNAGVTSTDHPHKLKINLSTAEYKPSAAASSLEDEIRRSTFVQPKHESNVIPSSYNPPPAWLKEEFKQLPNPSNIVSRLLLTTSPPSRNEDDDAPLDLSIKPLLNVTSNHQVCSTVDAISPNDDANGLSDDEEDGDDDEHDHIEEEEASNVQYLCSACPYKRSNFSAVQRHLALHSTGEGIACPLCSYTTSSEKSMIRHVTVIHPTSQVTRKFSPSTQMVTAHIIEQYQCPLCSYQCDCSDALERHRRLQHGEEQFDIDSSPGSMGAADEEMNGSEESDIDERHSTIQIPESTFQCPFCTSTNHCDDLQQFTMHVFTDHVNHIQNSQSCPFCSFVAHSTSIYSLPEHIKLHFNGTLIPPDPSLGMEHVKELFIE